MAGNILYIGNLFADMISKLTAVASKLDAQATKMDTQITSLNNINTSVAQNIAGGKIKAGTAVSLNQTHAEKQNSTGGTPLEVMRFKSLADGVLTIAANLKSASGTKTAALQYSVDGGTTKTTLFTTQSTSYTALSANIPIAYGQTLIIYLHAVDNGYLAYLQANTLALKYENVNVTIDGYFTAI